MGPWLFFISALCFLWAGVLAIYGLTKMGVAIAKAYHRLTTEFYDEGDVIASIFVGSCVIAGLITLGRFI